MSEIDLKGDVSPPEKLQGFEWWRRSLSYRAGLGLTPEEKKQFEIDFFHKQVPKKCEDCVKNRNWVLNYSPSVRFMMDHVNKLGGNININNIKCEPCDDLKGGGFHPELGILLCANWIKDKYNLEDILTHELIHAYDHLKFNVDLNNLKHHACTEIRASMLSGECRIFSEIKRTGLSNFDKKFQSCIKRRAILSVTANPNCKDKEEAERVVNSVWTSCFNDTRPFERVYR